jgi:hypothetical protein
MKHKLIMENWRKFTNEANEITPEEAATLPELEQEREIAVTQLVSNFISANYNYVMSDGPLQDDKLYAVISAKMELDKLQGEEKEFSSALITINRDRYGRDAGKPQPKSFAPTTTDKKSKSPLGPEDIDIDAF